MLLLNMTESDDGTQLIKKVKKILKVITDYLRDEADRVTLAEEPLNIQSVNMFYEICSTYLIIIESCK